MTDARRLVRHHAQHVVQQVHAMLWDIVPMVDDLRSFVSKTALTFLLVSVTSWQAKQAVLLHAACNASAWPPDHVGVLSEVGQSFGWRA